MNERTSLWFDFKQVLLHLSGPALKGTMKKPEHPWWDVTGKNLSMVAGSGRFPSEEFSWEQTPLQCITTTPIPISKQHCVCSGKGEDRRISVHCTYSAYRLMAVEAAFSKCTELMEKYKTCKIKSFKKWKVKNIIIFHTENNEHKVSK